MKQDKDKSGILSVGTAAPSAGAPFSKRKYSNFNWDSIDWNAGFSSLTNLFGNIFGNNDKAVVNAQGQIIEKQEKTMTILWVVIGMMAALGAFLLIRKKQ